MKKWIAVVLVALTVAGVANSGTIKTWTTEALLYSDLNETFQHIHNTMVGGHGARLVNADVSTSAAIAHSKLATPALLPKAMAYVAGDCTASPCTMAMNSGFTSITRTGVGEYTGTLSSARADTTYGVHINAFDASGILMCRHTAVSSTTVFTFSCFSAAAAADTGFMLTVWDNDN